MDHEYQIEYKNVQLRPLSKSDIDDLRQWRNNSKNSLYLKKIPYITTEKQNEWFKQYLENKDEICFAIIDIQSQHRLVGSLSLYNFTKETCEFGKILIGDSEAHGKKIGANATIAAIKIAFEMLGLNKVELHVYSNNSKAINVYHRAGFRIVSECRNNEGGSEYTMSITRGNDNLHNMDKVKMLEFPQLGDDRGHLVIVEGGKDIPFEIKRAFYIYGSDRNVVRGQHANRESEFVLINVAGKSKVKVKDGKGNETVFNLDRPHTGIYLPSMIWKDMYDFSEDSVLLVLASTHYDSNEYIRNYEEYVKEMMKG